VPQVVKTKALSLCKYDAGAYCRRPQMILYERRRPDRHFAVPEQRRKDEIIDRLADRRRAGRERSWLESCLPESPAA